MAAEGRKVPGAEKERRESASREKAQGIQREPRASRPHWEHTEQARAGPGAKQGQSYGEGLRGMWSGVHVGCLLLKSTYREMDRREMQREMAKEHLKEVQEGGTGAGQHVPLAQTCTPSCPFIPRKEGAADQSGPG